MDKDENNTKLKVSSKSVLILVVFIIIIYGSILFFQAFNDYTISFEKIEISTLFYVIFLTLGNYSLRIVKWRIGTRKLNMNVTLFQDIIIYIAGFLFSITPSKIGETARAWMLTITDSNNTFGNGLSLTVVDRLSDLMAMALISLLFSLLLAKPEFLIPIYVLIFLLVLLFITLHSDKMSNPVLKIVGKISKRLDKIVRSILSALRQYGIGKFIYVVLLSFISWSLEGVGLFLILRDLDIDITISLSILFFAVSTLLGALSFLPGGLGVAEISLIGLLVKFTNSSNSAAISATLLIRFATLWFGFFLGVIFYNIWLITSRRSNEKEGIGK